MNTPTEKAQPGITTKALSLLLALAFILSAAPFAALAYDGAEETPDPYAQEDQPDDVAPADYAATEIYATTADYGEYNAGDVAVINAIIDNNGLDWERWESGATPPTGWNGVAWSSDASDKRIMYLNVWSENLNSTLDVSGLTALTLLDCDSNNLTSLDLSGQTALEKLYCANNNLTSLNLTGLTALTLLDCDSNNLTSLDLSQQTALTLLSCSNNNLTSLNITGLTALTYLDCSNNNLTSLNLTGLTALTTLRCSSNNLTALDLSQQPGLTTLYLHNNPISHLKLHGGYELTVAKNPADGGEVVLGVFDYSAKTATLIARPYTGVNFSRWEHTGFTAEPIANGGALSFTLPPNPVTVTANFSGSGQPTPEQPGQPGNPGDPGNPSQPTQPVAVTGVLIPQTTVYVVKGKTVTLNAAVQPATAANKAVSWSSANTKIATVTNTGKIKGVKVGTTKLSVTSAADSSKTATVTVKVVAAAKPVTKFTISPSKDFALEVDATRRITVKVAGQATGVIPTFKSNRPAVATVDSAGVVTAKGNGSAVITVKVGNKTQKVTVKVGTVAASRVSLNKTRATVNRNRTITLVATVLPANANPATVSWSSNNTKVATVNARGVVRGRAKGTATITVTTWNGRTAKCRITVR
uniref:Internalin-related protein n=1 Tax=uncultured bacterium contig00006 TaxID=1181498 RepID=A0A806JZ75_9BACT|nr:internalin-related protein [uncultured bacterium contig00006]